jgi:hypothetical protein
MLTFNSIPSDKVLLLLGKSQFELRKLVDSYRVHVLNTITTPSQSLLNELQTVEEMKRQCDEKRELFEYMLNAQKEKGRSKNSKGDNSASEQQLKQAQDDYQEEATLFLFRLKSLKQGQFRSLFTQAARHHAAQVHILVTWKYSSFILFLHTASEFVDILCRLAKLVQKGRQVS